MPQKLRIFILLFFINVSLVFAGGIQEVSVTSVGYGSTENEAVQDALTEALGKIKGKQIDSEKISEIRRLIKNNKKIYQRPRMRKLRKSQKELFQIIRSLE